ncbi:MAG: hypothetical protein GX997_08805, partial [Bacteroidales bacterium]|nr:hypothetical protein [Bacteroidales bacterium]
MKNIFKIMLIVFLGSSVLGCEDYFETNPDNLINTDDYISTQSEMYSGFMGIITKMQEVGDHAIFLTDTRGDFLEPTVNAPEEIWDIYNYRDLNGNPFADPAGYYAVIIACNDYFQKMFEYKEKDGKKMDELTERHFNALISSALRIKTWAYLTLGKIYDEAVYFDDPLVELKDLSDNQTFEKLSSLDEVIEKCFELLDVGINGIDGTEVMDWGQWLDPEDPDNSLYVAWDYIVPDYLC